MHLSMWSNFYYDLSPEEAVEELCKAGFRYLELSDSHMADLMSGGAARLMAFADFCRSLEVGVEQLHAPIVSPVRPSRRDGDWADRILDIADLQPQAGILDAAVVEEWLEAASVAGIHCMVLHPGGYRGWSDDGEREAIRCNNMEMLRRLVCKAEESGVRIALENMAITGGESRRRSFGSRAEDLLDLVQEIDSPYMGICLDTSHANVMAGFDKAGFDMADFVRRAGKSLLATHISDNLGKDDDHLMPFAGKICWQPLMAALHESGYSGLFNLEIPGENRCALSVRRLKAGYAAGLLQLMAARPAAI